MILFLVVLGAAIAAFAFDRAGALGSATALSSAQRRVAWLSLLFAPFGAILRAELGRYNAVCPPLPLCTLLANLLGSAVGHSFVFPIKCITEYLTNLMKLYLYYYYFCVSGRRALHCWLRDAAEEPHVRVQS